MKFGDIDSAGELIGFLAFFTLLAFVFKNAPAFNNVAGTVTSSVRNLANV